MARFPPEGDLCPWGADVFPLFVKSAFAAASCEPKGEALSASPGPAHRKLVRLQNRLDTPGGSHSAAAVSAQGRGGRLGVREDHLGAALSCATLTPSSTSQETDRNATQSSVAGQPGSAIRLNLNLNLSQDARPDPDLNPDRAFPGSDLNPRLYPHGVLENPCGTRNHAGLGDPEGKAGNGKADSKSSSCGDPRAALTQPGPVRTRGLGDTSLQRLRHG